MSNYNSIYKVGDKYMELVSGGYGGVQGSTTANLSLDDLKSRQIDLNQVTSIDPSSIQIRAADPTRGDQQAGSYYFDLGDTGGIRIPNLETAQYFGINAPGAKSGGGVLQSQEYALDQARGRDSVETFSAKNPGWQPGQPIPQQPTQQLANAGTASKFEQGFESAKMAGAGAPLPTGTKMFQVDGKAYYSPTGVGYDAVPFDPSQYGVDIKSLGQGIKNASAYSGAGGAGEDMTGGLTSSQARGMIDQYTPQEKPANLAVDAFFQEDSFMQGLIKSFQDYISPANQKKSLTETYQQMVKSSGIEALDMELINTKKIIEGTEDDIRNEIMGAGGFATESQVMALTQARNKGLIKNYNVLLETRNAKEKYLNTMIGLEQQDRQEADQRFEKSFNMAMQIADYGMKMQKNALDAFERTKSAIGWTGIAQSVQNDPAATRLIEKMYGLPSGGLRMAAQQEAQARMQMEEERQLDLKSKQLGIQAKEADLAMAPLERQFKMEQIKTEQAQRAKIYSDIKKITDSNKGTILDPTTPEGRKQLAINKGQIDQVGTILKSGSLKTAVGPNALSRFGNWRSILTPGRSNFIGDVEQLRSQLSLQSLIDAKSRGATFGALSDAELQILSTSGTKIGSWLVDKNDPMKGYKVKETDFKRELDKINNFAKLDYVYRGGIPEDVGVQIINGKYYTLNSDGSITEL